MEHRRKTSRHTQRILVVKGAGGLSEAVKKKICDKNLFSNNIEWNSKKLWKIISADAKANIKQQEIKELVAVSYTFL